MQDLIDACSNALLEIDPDSNGISRRQIEQDIRYLESDEGGSIPLERHRDGKRIFYRYSDTKFSINNQPLNQVELEQIASAMQILSRFKGMPQFEWVNELAPKMEQTFLLEKHQETIISFDNNRYLKGIEYLGELFQAILYKKVLCLEYQSYRSEIPKEYQVHPYYLKQYNNRWFLLGLSETWDRISTFALDRIITIHDSNTPYISNCDYNFDDYFEDIIGVTLYQDAEPVLITLTFNKDAAPYVLSKPLHGSQKKISENESEVVVSIDVIPNYELESLILSYGDRVKVSGPESFQKVIKERLVRASGMYN
ncbi:WYL domain-containing protein [Dyadobacter endophyticus]|uniref:WYL domain-containing protein n=1 Tax=Dyadobacter endophyticus TaxID=1749036 RepID=A0ABQ1YS56_9BACT|nr:WYL domain-containing protein [Dyadobacter endophyticus]GGH36776.1 WYL domain-containing protein [Dyadobacter endophyticus]